MASSFTENNDAFINKSKIMLWKYAEGLKGKVKTRCVSGEDFSSWY